MSGGCMDNMDWKVRGVAYQLSEYAGNPSEENLMKQLSDHLHELSEVLRLIEYGRDGDAPSTSWIGPARKVIPTCISNDLVAHLSWITEDARRPEVNVTGAPIDGYVHSLSVVKKFMKKTLGNK